MADTLADSSSVLVIEDVAERDFSKRFNEDLAAVMTKLPDRSAVLLHECYWQGRKQAHIAKEIGVSRPVVGRQIRRAFEVLRADDSMRRYHAKMIGKDSTHVSA